SGPSTLSSLTLTDTASPALLSPSFTPSAGSYNSGTGAWTGLSLASGQTVTLTLTGTIDPTATGNEVNTATVSPPAGATDPATSINSAADTATLTPHADLAVAFTDGTTTVVPGTSALHTIPLIYNGPSTLSSLTLTDAAAPALLGPSFTPSTGSYDSATGSWT